MKPLEKGKIGFGLSEGRPFVGVVDPREVMSPRRRLLGGARKDVVGREAW